MSDNTAEDQTGQEPLDQVAIGRRKAAIAVMALGSATAQRLFPLLRPQEVEYLLAEAEGLENVEAMEVLSVLRSLTKEVDAHVAGVSGHNHMLEQAARRALGEEALNGILGQTAAESGPAATLRKAAESDPAAFARTISREHPQVVTVVLTLLDAVTGADVLNLFPQEMRTEVIQRMATIRSIPAAVIAEVAEIVGRELRRPEEAGPVKIDGTDVAVGLLKAVGQETETSIFTDLQSRDNELADHLRSLMFVFEDVINLQAREVQLILREIDSQQLAVALSGSSNELKEFILSNMSSRAAMIVLDEIEAMGSLSKAQVNEAQTAAVEIILNLAEEGKVNTRPEAE